MLDVLEDWKELFPAKLTVTATEPETWLTEEMEQDAAPDEFVVALQLCAVRPEPSVKVRGWPLSGVPLLESVPDSVTDDPLVAVVAPVYVTVVGAGVTTKLLWPLLGRSCGEVLVFPP